MKKEYDFIIIGAGPAGLTAALYASRAGLKTALLEKGAPGSKLLKTNEISNWPGTQTTAGADLASLMFHHCTSFGAAYLYGNVVQLRLKNHTKQVICEDGSIYEAPAVLAAAGTKERLLNIPGEEKNIGRGVSYCAVCDAAFYRGKDIAVIGAGNSALEEALYLTQFVRKVFILMRRSVFRAHQITVDAVLQNPKIEVIQKAVPIEIQDDGHQVTGLKIRFSETQEETLLSVSGIFPYIGSDPVTDFLNPLDVLDEQGYILVNTSMETRVPMLYGAGDACKKVLRQVVTAVSDGAVAAQDAFHKIRLL